MKTKNKLQKLKITDSISLNDLHSMALAMVSLPHLVGNMHLVNDSERPCIVLPLFSELTFCWILVCYADFPDNQVIYLELSGFDSLAEISGRYLFLGSHHCLCIISLLL